MEENIIEKLKKHPKCYFYTDLGVLINDDCLSVMRDWIPEKSIDLVLTDPPYNASNSNISCADKHYNTINEKWDKNFDLFHIQECVRINKGSMLNFCSYHLLSKYLTINLKLQQIIHWIKSNPFPAIAKVYTPNVEYIIWHIKKNPYTFNKNYAHQNILKTSICSGNERELHPTQKPLKLIMKLLLVHSNINDIIFDPFCGSGTLGVACEQLNRQYILIEKEEKYCAIAKERIQNEANQIKFDFETDTKEDNKTLRQPDLLQG